MSYKNKIKKLERELFATEYEHDLLNGAYNELESDYKRLAVVCKLYETFIKYGETKLVVCVDGYSNCQIVDLKKTDSGIGIIIKIVDHLTGEKYADTYLEQNHDFTVLGKYVPSPLFDYEK